MTKTLSIPLAEQVVAALGRVDPARLPPGVRVRAQSALACLTGPADRAPAVPGPAAPGAEEDGLLSGTACLAMVAHKRAGHREPSRAPDAGGCGCAVAAAAIGAAAAWGGAGATIVGAVAFGLELQQRLVLALGPGHQEAGWCVGGTAAPPAAALSAALVARTAPDRVAHAIGIATSLTLGHGAAGGSDVAAIHTGKAAANGLLAAALAAQGLTAAPTALEGPRGYFRVLGTDDAEADDAAEAVADGLGQRWRIDAPAGDQPPPWPDGRESPDPLLAALQAAATDDEARGLARQLLMLSARETS